MIPQRPWPLTRLKGLASARARARAWFSSSRAWATLATAGTITFLKGFFSKRPGPGRGVSSPRVTGPRVWFTRVVVRSSTGSPSSSERAKAARVISLASRGLSGSSMGRPDNLA